MSNPEMAKTHDSNEASSLKRNLFKERGWLVSPLTMLFLMVTSGHTGIQKDGTESYKQRTKPL